MSNTRRKNQLILKDLFFRKRSATFQERYVTLKAITSNEFLPRRYRRRAQNYLYDKYHKTKEVCKETARSRSVLSVFRLSRHRFRIYAETGFLLGVRRSSW